MRLMQQLGGIKCKSCGCKDYKILEFDHIHGDGTIDRKRLRNMKVKFVAYYLMHIEQARRKLQVLCSPCHRLKHGDYKKKKSWTVVYTV
jgi:hypothetical protein